MIPKFRAWVKKYKEMRNVYGIHFNKKMEVVEVVLRGVAKGDRREYVNYICRGDGFPWHSNPGDSFCSRFDDLFTLMQSTGLKDMNGVEIYEGDIVQMQWTIYDEPELFYIRTIEGRAPRVDNRIKGKELWLVHQDCKVVGNVYQNRELFEVAE